MLVHADRVTVAFGTQTVLADVSFTLSHGDKVGLVGPNGSGKTTLLRLILQELEPDDGEVTFGERAEMGYVRQDVVEAGTRTVHDVLLGEADELEKRLARLRREISRSPGDDGALAKYEVLEEELGRRFGPDYRSRVEKVLAQFGLRPGRFRTPVMSLSPGERARLELARVLVGRHEVLILDEPTNYLDIGQREWLEKFLAEFAGTVLVVSHDRVFLNRVVNRIFELRRCRLRIYEGDYDDYEFQRQQEQRELEEKHSRQQKGLRKPEAAARERRTWAAGREEIKTGAGDSGVQSHRAARMAKRAGHAEMRIEQMLDKRRADRTSIEGPVRPVPPSRELPDKRAVFARGLRKAFGRNKVVVDASFELRTGERVALVGPSGCGKTVLLRMLVGELAPDGGEAGFGAELRVGYFPQDLGALDLDLTALQEVMKSGAKPETARTVLGSLLLPREFAAKKLRQLSAGERAKVLLARILAAGADVLVLDEPTNHLDLDVLVALERLLQRFQGAVLFASHDRAMVERLATRVLEFRDGRLEERRNGRAAGNAKS